MSEKRMITTDSGRRRRSYDLMISTVQRLDIISVLCFQSKSELIDISVQLLCEILGDIKNMDSESTRQAFQSLIDKLSKDGRQRYEDIRPSISGVARFLQEGRYNDEE